MNPINEEALRERLELLNRIDFELVEQDTLALELIGREGTTLASAGSKSVVSVIFGEVVKLDIGFHFEPTWHLNSFTVEDLRRFIRSARAKVIWERRRVRGLLGLPPLPGEGADEPVAAANVTEKMDKSDAKKVFVVHGRNHDARQAIFDFLTHLGLEPIEWEEAVQSTGKATPTLFDAIENAFTTCRAAVVILSGDDLARLGKHYLEPHDEAHEINLTRQARPNVLFEAGMAFGKMPSRTLVVSFGRTRKFTDLEGFNPIFIVDTPECRTKIANRLKDAGCSVDLGRKTDWMKAGNFGSGYHDDKSLDWTGKSNLIVVEKRPDAAEGENIKPKVWIEVVSESDACLSVGHLGWTETTAGIRIERGYKSLQVKIGNCWCPTDVGIESVVVPPKGHIRTWVQPNVVHNLDDLKRRVKVEGQIGTLRLRVDGRELDISV